MDDLVECPTCGAAVDEDDIRSSPVDRDGAPHHEDTYPECEDPDHVRLSSFRDEIAFTAERDLTGSSALDGVVRHDPFLAHITTGYDGDLLEIEPGTPIPVKGVRVAFGTEIYDITVTGSTVEASAKTGIGVLDALTVRADALLSELSNRVSAVEAMRGIRP